MATKLERGGGKALVAVPLKNNFFAASLIAPDIWESDDPVLVRSAGSFIRWLIGIRCVCVECGVTY